MGKALPWVKWIGDYQLELIDESPIRAVVGQEEVDGIVVSLGEGMLLVALERDLGPKISFARLILDDSFLVERLKKKLEGVRAGGTSFNQERADQTIGERPSRSAMVAVDQGLTLGGEPLNDEQRVAIATALSSEITYLWGPLGRQVTLEAVLRRRLLVEPDHSIVECVSETDEHSRAPKCYGVDMAFNLREKLLRDLEAVQEKCAQLPQLSAAVPADFFERIRNRIEAEAERSHPLKLPVLFFFERSEPLKLRNFEGFLAHLEQGRRKREFRHLLQRLLEGDGYRQAMGAIFEVEVLAKLLSARESISVNLYPKSLATQKKPDTCLILA